MSGLTPGPLMAMIISETLSRGAPAGARVALAPLFTDSVVLALGLWGLGPFLQKPAVLAALSLVGAAFLIRLGWPLVLRPAVPVPAAKVAGGILRRAIGVNATNPNLYLFWLTVGTPLVSQAWQQQPWRSVGFLLAFWTALVGSMAGIAVFVSRTRHWVKGPGYARVLRILGFVLWGFSGLFLWRALQLLQTLS